ncbi:hypothetical protein [Alteromonas gilva]|uniref:Uncharacterized protein n=1 Tax=Alteromonas gilva TaxID=2987522 RepID=A0ABT5L9T6_9ALTE|nr:hypothetical protein [Alteromonas gilva]MDC8832927.1 hypothetical protein [Alteromonas gilva]
MKNFVVKLNIQTGEYEKNCTKLIVADNQEDAGNQAMLSECHGDLGESAEWTESGISDLFWEFHYSVYSVTEVKPEHYEILKLYI